MLGIRTQVPTLSQQATYWQPPPIPDTYCLVGPSDLNGDTHISNPLLSIVITWNVQFDSSATSFSGIICDPAMLFPCLFFLTYM